MKKKTIITIISFLSIILVIILFVTFYLKSEAYQEFIDNNMRLKLIEDIPLLDGDFTLIESEGVGKSFFGESSIFYVIQFSNNDYEKQLTLFETSGLYQNTDGYLNEVIVRDYTNFAHNNSFNEITKCDCYRILKKTSYTSKYSEYIYLINDNQFAIIIDKN